MDTTTSKDTVRLTTMIVVSFALSAASLAAFFIFSLPVKPQPKPPVRPTVDQLSQQLLSLNDTYNQTPSTDQAAALANLKSVVSQRKSQMLELLHANPKQFLASALDDGQRSKLPDAVSADIEHRVDLEGRLDTFHGDDFVHNKTFDHHTLTTSDQQQYEIVYTTEPTTESGQVKISGLALDTSVVEVTTTPDTSAPVTSINTTAAAPIGKKIAVILFNFASNPIQPYTPSSVYDTLFNGPTSVKSFFEKTSGGQITLIGDSSGVPLVPPNPNGNIYVFGWYTINTPATGCETNAPTWATLANAQAPAGVLTGFDKYIYAFPEVAGCTWTGLGGINDNKSFNNGNPASFVFSHELGHNFGVHHASSMSCTQGGLPVSVSDTCTTTEYGDPYDVMGGAQHHFNSFHQDELGYYQTDNVQTVTTSGSYTLYPLEVAPYGNVVHAIRIPRPFITNGWSRDGYYYLEYRQTTTPFDVFTGNERVTQGITIHLGSKIHGFQSELVDATPSTPSFYDATLLPGQTYTDPDWGLTMTVTVPPDLPARAVLNITLVCVHRPPIFNYGFYAPTWLKTNSPVPLSVYFTNGDPPQCGSSAFSFTGALPAGWTQTDASVTLEPGLGAFVPASITAPTGTANGRYDFTEMATNLGSPTSSTTMPSYSTVDGTPPTTTITQPPAPSLIDGPVQITANSTDNYPINTIVVLIDGVMKQQCFVSRPTGSCSYVWNVTTAVTGGNHTISAITKDQAGNSSRKDITVCRAINTNGTKYKCGAQFGGPLRTGE